MNIIIIIYNILVIMKLDKLLVIPNESIDNYVNLPNSILEKLAKNKNIATPYFFQLETSYHFVYYVGVKQFTSTEGTIEVPSWIANNLGVDYINLRLLKNVPKGKFVKIQPLSVDFFDVPENDVVLEKALSNYCILQANMVIDVKLFDKIYKIKIVEIKDDEDIIVDYADIINVDLNVDFENKFPKKEPIVEPIKNDKVDNIGEMIDASFINEPKKEQGKILAQETDVKILSPEEVRKARLAYYDKIFPKKEITVQEKQILKEEPILKEEIKLQTKRGRPKKKADIEI